MIKKLLLGFLSLLIIAFIGLFAWGYAPDIPVSQLKDKYANAESEFVDVDGMQVHLRDEGPADAPAIILLHGSNASLHTWDAWTAALKGKYRVIRYDQAGHGLTGPHPRNCYTAACFTGVVNKIAEERGLTKFALGGNSMGGWISYEYAKAFPDRLSHLILVDPSGAPAAKPADLPIGFKIAQMPGINKLMNIITPRSFIEKSLRQTVSVQSVVTDAEVDEYWELLRRPGNREATIKRFAARSGMTPSVPIANSPIPTLIMWGDEDRLINVGAAPWFARQFPNNQITIYKGIGHLPMEEIADKSAADTAQFMER
jgi:pimeloyl-ACP methyl ester carboxylesterase